MKEVMMIVGIVLLAVIVVLVPLLLSDFIGVITRTGLTNMKRH